MKDIPTIIEGTDGSGKTTQTKLLVDRLRNDFPNKTNKTV